MAAQASAGTRPRKRQATQRCPSTASDCCHDLTVALIKDQAAKFSLSPMQSSGTQVRHIVEERSELRRENAYGECTLKGPADRAVGSQLPFQIRPSTRQIQTGAPPTPTSCRRITISGSKI